MYNLIISNSPITEHIYFDIGRKEEANKRQPVNCNQQDKKYIKIIQIGEWVDKRRRKQSKCSSKSNKVFIDTKIIEAYNIHSNKIILCGIGLAIMHLLAINPLLIPV